MECLEEQILENQDVKEDHFVIKIFYGNLVFKNYNESIEKKIGL